jgi:hypothetical protein
MAKDPLSFCFKLCRQASKRSCPSCPYCISRRSYPRSSRALQTSRASTARTRLANEAVAPIVTKQVFIFNNQHMSLQCAATCVVILKFLENTDNVTCDVHLNKTADLWLLRRFGKRRTPHAAWRSEVSTDSSCKWIPIKKSSIQARMLYMSHRRNNGNIMSPASDDRCAMPPPTSRIKQILRCPHMDEVDDSTE